MEVIHIKPNDSCPKAEPGDFLLIRGTGWLSRLILWFQHYSHVVSFTEYPYIADAQYNGVKQNTVSKYDDTERVLVKIDASEEDRQQMLNFLDSVIAAKWGYNYFGFFVSGFMILTGGGWSVRTDNTSYCSGLGAETLVRAGHIFKKSPNAVNPDDLADHFGV